MPRLDEDRFHLLDKLTAENGGATVEQLAKLLGLPKRTTMTWLCRWQNYYNAPRDIVQHFVTRVPDTYPHVYKAGPDWWGERFNRGQGEAWHDEHDVEGINGLHVSLGFMLTRTDSVTGKRTLKGTRKTDVYKKFIQEKNGVTTAEFARKFEMDNQNASVTLSRWKKNGILERKDGNWYLKGQKVHDVEIVQAVVSELDESGHQHTSLAWKAVERMVKEEAV